ncbi:MAG TPA: glycosyltransferase family 4 protein [Candidatus Paceibacterota bacterium]|nr:glycosyltransferase family 4 protein [Candidatus Paceibacterota bacterium]
MKLFYLFNGRLPTEKAHGGQIVHACSAFAEVGVEVTLVFPYRQNPIQENIYKFYGVPENFKVRHVRGLDASRWLPGPVAFHIQNLVSAFWMIRSVRPYRNQADTLFYARDYASLRALAAHQFPFAAEIHDYRFSRPRAAIGRILSAAKIIVANSAGTKEALIKHYPHVAAKIRVVPNGVEPEFFAVPQTSEQAREKVSLLSDKKLVAYVGRLESAGTEKGIDVFLRALNEISDPDIAGYVIGGPEELVKKYKAAYPKVIFVGQVSRKDIPLYLRALDIVVIPLADSRHARTSSPIKLFEFFAAGKAIIASRVPAVSDYADEKSVVFFDPGSSSELAARIRELAGDEKKRRMLEQHVLVLAQRHTWTARARNILSHLS